MALQRTYYSEPISHFLRQSAAEVLGGVVSHSSSQETTIQQQNAWEEEIALLQEQLNMLKEGHILFEYEIPRMGKRIDVVLLHQNIVFLLEFKCGERTYQLSAERQVMNYALDLHDFHKESHDKLLVPILIATQAPSCELELGVKQGMIQPIRCNGSNLGEFICRLAAQFQKLPFDYAAWISSPYLPTPTIVEAAQALYRQHSVQEITRNDAGATNLSVTTEEINRIIDTSKTMGRKSICFVTGVPGAGKTLVGLNIAIQHSNAEQEEPAVFLSGNQPLVTVLQEALARDKVEQEKQGDTPITKETARRETASFIQIIHRYRDSFVGNNHVPPEHVAIFDEAQRAWTHEKIADFMKRKKGVAPFPQSEPEFLISTMDRHQDWAVIICLVGGGQEINTGEAGLPEWFDSLHRSFPTWDVYITPQLHDAEYLRGRRKEELVDGLRVETRESLHLATSVRSFRTPDLAAFVKALLDSNMPLAQRLHTHIRDKYPIILTRDLEKAKAWVRERCLGDRRYGLLASSGGHRLKAEGIFVKNDINVANWFLNAKEDVRSSYALEDVATEFDIQGLELDYSIVAWDADMRRHQGEWSYHNFSGSSWKSLQSEERRLYLKNTYRVLLTRARQGMILYVPTGSASDTTRQKEWYEGISQYLKDVGIPEH